MQQVRGTRRRRATMRMLLAAVSTVFLVATTAAVAAASPTPTSSDSVPVVFIVDASGSMVRDTATGETRMDVAKAATIQAIEALPPGTEVGMLVFGTGTSNDDSQRAAGCQDIVTVAPLAPLDVDGLSAGVRGITASGFTPIGPALRAAVDMLPPGERGNIVLISDGVDTCAPPSSCEVASQLHRDHPLISIHVVAFAVDDDEAVQQQMSCIGGVGGGSSVQASDATQLAARLRAASNPSSSDLTARGMRGVELGMSLDEVRNRVDGAKVGDVEVVDGVEVVYVDCGWGTVELRDDRVWAITPARDDVGTAEGFSAGTPLVDIEAVLGPPVDAGTTGDGDFHVYPVSAGSPFGYRVFWDTSKKATRIVLCRCIPLSAVSTRVADWEISFAGVGPLELGMSAAQAQGAVPQLYEMQGAGLWGFTDVNGQTVLTLTFIEDVLAKIEIGDRWGDAWGAGLPHARGIRLGDTGATAQNTFPGGSYFSVHVGGTSDYVVSDRDGHLISFGAPGSAGFLDGVEDVIRASPITTIVVEDAALYRSEAAFGFLYGNY